MSALVDNVLDELRAAGHLSGALPPSAAEPPVSRWILALQVMGGWMAANFFLGFVGIGATALVKTASGWMVLGVLATALAGFALQRAQGVFLQQFLLPLSLAGQAAFAIGAVDLAHGAGWWLVGLFEIAVFVLVPWPLHRFLAGLGALYAIQAAIVGDFVLGHRASATLGAWLQALYWAGACVLFADELRWRASRAAPLLGVLAAALVVHCLAAASIPLALELGGAFTGKTAVALGLPLVSFACLAYLGRDLWRSGSGWLLLVALAGVLAVTWQSPGLAVGSTAMVLGFANGRRWLLWLGGLVALAGIGRFYYFLEVDLLAKSAYLVLGGLLLLAARHLLLAREVANDA